MIISSVDNRDCIFWYGTGGLAI